jgi:hypothetical protein
LQQAASLLAGTAIDFTGKAVTRKDGKIHVVLGKATPSSGDRGSVTFSITPSDFLSTNTLDSRRNYYGPPTGRR